jgi:hypothetical protein
MIKYIGDQVASGAAPIEAAGAAVQESGQTYVEKSSETYDKTLEKTGSYTAAAHAAYNPLSFYADLAGRGYDYLTGGDKKDETLPAGAVGATVDQSGAMIVHDKEELIPARITSGAGKLALSWDQP